MQLWVRQEVEEVSRERYGCLEAGSIVCHTSFFVAPRQKEKTTKVLHGLMTEAVLPALHVRKETAGPCVACT